MRGMIALVLASPMVLATGCLDLLDDAGSDSDPYTLRIPVPPDVRLALYQDGDGPWQPLTIGADGFGEARIRSRRFGHALVCPLRDQPPGFPPGLLVPVVWRTRGDALQPDPCNAPPSVNLHVVVPNMNYLFNVHVGDTIGTPSSGPDMPVPAGVWDVASVAMGYLQSQRTVVAIQRDVDLRAGGTITVDLSQQGVDLLPMSLPAIERSGIVDDSTSYSTEVELGGGTHALLGYYDPMSGNPQPPMLPPPNLVEADDQLWLRVDAGNSDPFRSRGRVRPISGQTTAPVQLPVYPDVTYDANGVTWTGDWYFAHLQLGYMSQATPPTMYLTQVDASVTGGWLLDADAPAALPRFDPTTLPGWDPSWQPPPTWIGWMLDLSTVDPSGERTWVQTGGGGPP